MSAKRDSEVVRLEPGEKCPPAEVGDTLFIVGTSWISRLILLVEPYSHVVCFVDAEHAADAQAHGVVERAVSVYENTHRVFVRLAAHSRDRSQMSAFLASVLAERWRYGFVTFLFCGLSMLTGYRLSVGLAETAICSGLTSACLVRTGAVFPKPPMSMTPGDLARALNAV